MGLYVNVIYSIVMTGESIAISDTQISNNSLVTLACRQMRFLFKCDFNDDTFLTREACGHSPNLRLLVTSVLWKDFY